MINNLLKRSSLLYSPLRYSFSNGATFLKMVESFFDRAAVHTGIRSDRLNFYKKAENVVKCSIPLIRGNIFSTKTMAQLKPFLLIVANTRLINYQQKEELDTQKMWILKKFKPLLV
jgi:hypothetical protein